MCYEESFHIADNANFTIATIASNVRTIRMSPVSAVSHRVPRRQLSHWPFEMLRCLRFMLHLHFHFLQFWVLPR